MFVEWGLSIVLDFFFGGIAVGTFIFSVVFGYYYSSPEREQKIVRIAAYISPISMTIALFFLVLHLGQPLRIFWAFLNFNFTSALAWGGLFQGLFVLGIFLYAFMLYQESLESQENGKTKGFLKVFNNPVWRRRVGFIGLPNAIIVGVNHGFLLMSFESRPLWNTGATILMAVVSVIVSGLALVFLIQALRSKITENMPMLRSSRSLLTMALVAQFFNIVLWIITMMFGPGDAYHLILAFMGQYLFSFWGMAVLAGLCVPIFLNVRDILEEHKTGSYVFRAPIFSMLLILFGSFFLRYSIIMAGQFLNP